MITSRKEVIEQREVFSVFVVYEDVTTRNRAIRISQRLLNKFGLELSIDFSWWKFLYLEERNLAALASKNAAEADVIIVSAGAGEGLPWAVKHWIESWVSRKRNGPSALVALIVPANGPADEVTPRHLYLKNIAHRPGWISCPHTASVAPSEGGESSVKLSRHAETGTPGMGIPRTVITRPIIGVSTNEGREILNNGSLDKPATVFLESRTIAAPSAFWLRENQPSAPRSVVACCPASCHRKSLPLLNREPGNTRRS